MAQKSVDQAKKGCESLKTAVGETTEVFGNTYSTAIKGASEYNLKVIAIAGANINAALAGAGWFEFDPTNGIVGNNNLI